MPMPINSFDDYPMSWHPKRSELSNPLYISLADLMARDIRSGKLTAGVRLPPQRELADFLDLNLSTITKAYKLCEARGLVNAVVGSGTFVAPHAGVRASVVDEHPGKTIELGTIYPYYEDNDIVRDVAREILADDASSRLFEYSDPLGSERQAAIGAKWLNSLGVDASPRETIISSGVQSGLAVILSSLFEPGDKIIVDEYTYPNFISLCGMLHLQLIPIANDDEGMLPDELQNACITQKPKGIYLMPSGSNPTNIAMSAQRKAEVARIVRRFGLLAIEDDNYSALLEEPPAPLVGYIPEQCIYIAGLSKPVCSGLRIAYLRVPEAYRDAVVQGAINQNLKIPSLNIEIASRLVERGMAHTIAANKRRRSVHRNQLFAQSFPQVPVSEVAFCQWMDLPDGCSGRSAEIALSKSGVAVFGAERFAVSSNASVNRLRIATCSPASDEQLLRGLELVGAYMDTFDREDPRFIV